MASVEACASDFVGEDVVGTMSKALLMLTVTNCIKGEDFNVLKYVLVRFVRIVEAEWFFLKKCVMLCMEEVLTSMGMWLGPEDLYF